MGNLIINNVSRCPNHPTRKVKSRGLCGSCYDKILRAENPEYAARQKANTEAWVEQHKARSKELQKQWNQKHGPEYGHVKKLRSYGITPQDYEHMLKVQEGRCNICRKSPDKDKRLHIDHNHDTGQVRGLLCFRCNFGLSFFHDSPEMLERAVSHLRNTTMPEAE